MAQAEMHSPGTAHMRFAEHAALEANVVRRACKRRSKRDPQARMRDERCGAIARILLLVDHGYEASIKHPRSDATNRVLAARRADPHQYLVLPWHRNRVGKGQVRRPHNARSAAAVQRPSRSVVVSRKIAGRKK
jgi:hypothetical protein